MRKFYSFLCLALSVLFATVACAKEGVTIANYIDIEQDEITVWVGEQIDIDVSTSFYKYDLIWESTNPRSADIYHGKLTAVKIGEATIIATDPSGKIADSIKVIVKQKAFDFYLDGNQIEIGLGEVMKLSVALIPADAEKPNFTYESSDETILSVNRDGEITGMKEGTAVITVKGDKISKSITLKVSDGAEYDIRPTKITDYIYADRAESYALLLNYVNTEYNSKIYYDTQDLKLNWESDGSSAYRVMISESEDFANFKDYYVSKNEISKGTFIPGKTYFIKVTGDSGILVDKKIKIKDAPVRMVNIDGVGNVRDLGGWTTASGNKVRYGLILRGAELNGNNGSSATSTGKTTVIDELGIKTEIDLRMSSEKTGLTDNSLGLNKYLWKPFYPYSYIIPENNADRLYGDGYQTASAGYLKDIFNCLLANSHRLL